MAYVLALIVWVYLRSNVCSGLQKPHLFYNRMRIGRSRSFKVNGLGTNRKRICDFLFVRHSDLGPILHRFWDTATYWLKNANTSTIETIESKSHGLSCSEDRMIVSWVVLTQHPCRLWRTDRQAWRTDRRIYYSHYSALHSKRCWRAVKCYKAVNTTAW